MAKTAAEKKAPAKKAGSKVSSDTIFKSHEAMKSLVDGMEEDVRKFTDEGVAAAARRIRGQAQELKKLCGQFRKDVIALVKQNKGK